jgi:hypothetical protein
VGARLWDDQAMLAEVCRQVYANGLQRHHLSTDLHTLIGLGGVAKSLRDCADDILRGFSGIDLSTTTTRRATHKVGKSGSRGPHSVTPLLALYQSGPEVWGAFWALAD